MRKTLGYLFTLALPVAAIGVLAAWMLGLAEPQGEAPKYEASAATRGSIRKTVSSSGPVRALVTVSVGSQLSGQIDAVKVDFNSEVKPGDVLATLDKRTYEARAKQSAADLAVADAALVNQEASLTRAEAVLKVAERTIDRQTSLAAKGFAAQSTLDNATRDKDIARAEIAVAKAQITSAKATITQRKAALEQATIDLDRTDITSPISGTVISRTVDPGQTVAASLQAPELFKIAQDLARIRIEAQVNEADVGSVSEGNAVRFTVDAYPDRTFEGRVTQVRLAATELNNVVTYTVIVEAGNTDRKLFPGMTANVEIESANKDGVLRVANDAFRFKPKSDGAADGKGDSKVSDRIVRRIVSDVELTDEQHTALKAEVAKLLDEMQRDTPAGMGGGLPDPATLRQKIAVRVDQTLGSGFSDEQRRRFEAWKTGKDSVRPNAVWVLTETGAIERRSVKTGLQDDRFTEIVSGELADGEQVVLRVRPGSP